MTIFWILVVAGLVIYLIIEIKKDKEQTKNQISYKQILPEYYNKHCEIRVKTPMPSLDIMYSVKGILVDIDDKWIRLEVTDKKKTTTKIMKIENINGIKRLVE